MTPSAAAFLRARDFLLQYREDYGTAWRDFRWPDVAEFNWAIDYFDEMSRGNDRIALWMVSETGIDKRYSFSQLSERSNQVANFLRRHGIGRGDRILVMLPNIVAMWEVLLAAIKLGAVVIPTASLMTATDLRDRIDRGTAKLVVTSEADVPKFDGLAAGLVRIAAGSSSPGWIEYESAYAESKTFTPAGLTRAIDPLVIYFTSGTTAQPKLVMHSHQSYPIGHLATMYWIGLMPGDIHLNVSSPGWAKHAWSSFFAPWNAGATIFVHQYSRFSAHSTLTQIARCGVTTLCAPPTVWRMCILEKLESYSVRLREIVSAGEPLNAEIIDRVHAAWGVNIRDGFGQTESVCLIGNSPGQPIKPGSVGRPTPGHRMALLNSDDQVCDDGELSVQLAPRPISLFQAYVNDPERTHSALSGSHYRTGDLASRDTDGYYHYIGRADDVFKSSDYRVSPFELESVLIEHYAIAESAVVPSLDKVRWSVPKAFVVLRPGFSPSVDIARDILMFARERLGPHKRVRRIEFTELPKTISGKIRRIELRALENIERDPSQRRASEYWEEDFLGDKNANRPG